MKLLKTKAGLTGALTIPADKSKNQADLEKGQLLIEEADFRCRRRS